MQPHFPFVPVLPDLINHLQLKNEEKVMGNQTAK